MREIKFRIWNPHGKNMLYDIENVYECLMQQIAFDESQPSRGFINGFDHRSEGMIWMQYTGAIDADGKEIYEGDIYRIEEETDKGDERTYFVCHYIKEWGMFAWLTSDEYYDYLAGGVENIDECMYWTFPIKTEDSKTVKLCGNIYENEYLLSEELGGNSKEFQQIGG